MWALVPVKRFAAGKSRLAGVLSEAQRAELTCNMLEDVLAALQRARSVQRIVVLSSEAGLDAMLEAAGIERCPHGDEGNLNASLASFLASVPSSVARGLIVPSDVPAVSVADVEALRRVHVEGSIALCPATTDGGTNALLSPVPLAISPRFGARSLARHLADARCRGLSAKVFRRQGLARDIDRSSDLEWLASSGHSGRAAAYARCLLQRRAELKAV